MPNRKKVERSANYSYYSDLLWCTVPLIGMSWYYYGARPVLLLLAALLTAYLCDCALAPLHGTGYQSHEPSSECFAALIVLLIFIAMVFINNTIRLAILARRKEIAIMRLVGASNGFIRGPFLMEGALHAIIGSLLAVGCLELLRNLVLPKVQGALAFLPFDLSLNSFLLIYLVLVVAGLLIGLIGSALAMRRYLKV